MSTQVHPPAPHSVNTATNGAASGKVAAASHHRAHVSGLNLPASQAVSITGGQKHELMYVPASSVPNFGSYGVIDIKDKNVLIHGINLQFVCSPVVGTTLTGYFNPFCYAIQRLEIVVNGIVIDQLMGNQQHLLTQFLEFDEDRTSLGLAQGLYSSTSNRTALSVYKLTDERIDQIDVDIPNTTSIKNSLLRVHRISKGLMLGVVRLNVRGQKIRIYSRERALCDIYKADPDGPVFYKALKRYVKAGEVDSVSIAKFDKKLKTSVLKALSQELADG